VSGEWQVGAVSLKANQLKKISIQTSDIKKNKANPHQTAISNHPRH